jgi:hypothetical protein
VKYHWRRQQSIEKAGVQAFKDRFEVVVLALWTGKKLSSSNLFDQMSLPAHIGAIEVQAVTVRVRPRDALSVEFPEQNLRQRLHNRGGGSREEVRHPDF